MTINVTDMMKRRRNLFLVMLELEVFKMDEKS